MHLPSVHDQRMHSRCIYSKSKCKKQGKQSPSMDWYSQCRNVACIHGGCQHTFSVRTVNTRTSDKQWLNNVANTCLCISGVGPVRRRTVGAYPASICSSSEPCTGITWKVSAFYRTMYTYRVYRSLKYNISLRMIVYFDTCLVMLFAFICDLY